jgi:hypothetical protein
VSVGSKVINWEQTKRLDDAVSLSSITKYNETYAEHEILAYIIPGGGNIHQSQFYRAAEL